MFGIYGVNGPMFHGRLEDLPAVRPVVRRQPVPRIGSDGGEFDDIIPDQAGADAAGVAAYRRMLRIDQERGPLLHAGQIMQREIISVYAEDSVVHAWNTLTGNRIHQAPVLDASDILVGIVSERDLLTALNLDNGRIRDALTHRVADVMTSPVVAAAPLTDIRRIAHVMLARDVDGVPIMNEHDRMVGFISRGDVLRAVVADPPLSLWR